MVAEKDWDEIVGTAEDVRRIFEQQGRDEALILVAEVNGTPGGQAWIDLERRRGERLAGLDLPAEDGCATGLRNNRRLQRRGMRRACDRQRGAAAIASVAATNGRGTTEIHHP